MYVYYIVLHRSTYILRASRPTAAANQSRIYSWIYINLGVSFASANTARNIIDLAPSVVCNAPITIQTL